MLALAFLAAVCAVVAILRWSDPRHAPAPARTAHPGADAGDPIESGTDAAPPPERASPEAMADAPCEVRVLGEDRVGIADASAFVANGRFWTPGALDDARDPRTLLGSSGSDGEILIPKDRCPGSGELVVAKVGYEPAFVSGVASGARIEVTLARAFGVDLRVVDEDGHPIAGYSIRFARAALESGEAPDGSSCGMLLRESRAGGGVSVAVSDADGRIRIRQVAAGTYFLRGNDALLPYSSFGVPASLTVPCPPVTIVLHAYWCGVLRFTGDEIVTVSRPNLGTHAIFRGATSQLESRVTAKLRRDLVERFPDCVVVVGMPRSRALADRSGPITVFGRFSGWSTHRLRVTSASGPIVAQVVALSGGNEDRTGFLTVVGTDAAGHEIALPGAGVCVDYSETMDWLASVRLEIGERGRVPAGACRVYPAGMLPGDSFAPIETTMRAGDDTRLAVPLDHLNGYRFRVQLLDGTDAREWGLLLETNGEPLYPCRGPEYLLYAKQSPICYRAFVPGYEACRGTTATDGIAGSGGRIHDVVITMARLRNAR